MVEPARYVDGDRTFKVSLITLQSIILRNSLALIKGTGGIDLLLLLTRQQP